MFIKHMAKLTNFGVYENISRSMAVSCRGLAALADFLEDVLKLCPSSNLLLTQARLAILNANKVKAINPSRLQNQVWAGQRAERIVTILAHVRRVKREPLRLQQALKKGSQDDGKKLAHLLSFVHLGGTASSFTGTSPEPKRRKLLPHPSKESEVSVDSLGVPQMVTSQESEVSELDGSLVLTS